MNDLAMFTLVKKLAEENEALRKEVAEVREELRKIEEPEFLGFSRHHDLFLRIYRQQKCIAFLNDCLAFLEDVKALLSKPGIMSSYKGG